ncbi:MAG: hypothetical protein P4L26_07845, partial [Terracidiphilus sp.]|nr:hypothetical protein [Terracidiphilus sp.]
MDIQKELESELDREAGKTRKMLEAIPEGVDWAWKPHAKSMSLGKLAGHLTDMPGEWGISTLIKDKVEFAADHKWDPYVPANRAELLDRFDGELAKCRVALAAVTPEKWDQNWKFIFAG